MALNPERIGKILAQLRKARGLTQGQIAERVGLTLNYISLVERGRRMLSVEALGTLGDVLKVPSELLVFLTADSKAVKGNPHLAELISETQEAILLTIGVDAMNSLPKQ